MKKESWVGCIIKIGKKIFLITDEVVYDIVWQRENSFFFPGEDESMGRARRSATYKHLRECEYCADRCRYHFKLWREAMAKKYEW